MKAKINKKTRPVRNCLARLVVWIRRQYHEHECLTYELRYDSWCMFPKNLKYRERADCHFAKAKELGSNIEYR